MKTLILHPTDTSQWHALVNEAQAATRLLLEEDTESYLVFLLMRYTGAPHMLESVLALDVLESMKALRQRKSLLMRDVGDKSLLFCGLFPGIARRRNVGLTYYADIGQAAYQHAGEMEGRESGALYLSLSSQFNVLRQILQAMRMEYLPGMLLDARMPGEGGEVVQ
ncbi:hypothetical protein Lgee_2132 [Legionella geestiana]|uniref:Uncharacterized protein n=1 Tax=Legionella geestiana TaxID=45065 RepID=A0A0W0TLI1_9GAMM|nr:hypothetical protein [Legionella geestiana]KTC96449.1 hypothetical protein Lgee_2132 [Legionella geestiana]QBS12495.1 hypothetical protein E4T54_06875 [Legionella geestiana]QDQ39791.1 hypothetical protein E3226_004990 [Legionella geestiana]STX55062.1 Uncharacterised protein [Legionella geestiana]